MARSCRPDQSRRLGIDYATTSRPRFAALLMVAGLGVAATGCGSSSSGPPSLQWYTNPDNGGQAELARRCTAAADGRYRIETRPLPRSASDQREQLLRRLAAKDNSIDLMSLDPVFVPEFSQAGFFAPIPRDQARSLSDGVVRSAVTGATWKGRLVAVPFWANTQLLWYRKSIARKAGLDLQNGPVTWQTIIRAARRTHTTTAVQAKRYEGYTVLINALIESSGGHILENPGARPANLKLGIATPAGTRAAATIKSLVTNGVGGPELSNTDEEAARTLFQSSDGGFMVNWPYVWPAAQAAVHDGQLSKQVLADIGWARFPRTMTGKASRPPLGGIDLAVGHWSKHPQFALDAARCVTSAKNQTYYFVNEGNPAARSAVFSSPAVRRAFPMAPLLRESLQQSAPRPRTEVYGDLSDAIVREWHPPNSVNSSTPANSSKFILEVLQDKRLV
jgi:multiple sugar transport system substrate-binding protein